MLRQSALLVPLFVVVAATTARAQQSAPRPDSGRVTTSGNSVTVAPTTANRGYLGLAFGGAVGFGPDGKPMWADYPVIRTVDANSPGALAGVRPGDAVIAQNGTDARTITKLFSTKAPGDTFVVRFRRGSEMFDVTMVSTAKPAPK